MDSLIFFALLAIAAIFVVRGNSEGWRPFAWYGAPPGTYQAKGDWSGIVPATTTVEQVIAPQKAKEVIPKKK